MDTILHPQHHDLLVADARRDELRQLSLEWPSWTVAGPALADLEALLAGWLWPLDGYDTRGSSATDRPGAAALGRLAGVALDVSSECARVAAPGVTVALRDPEGVLLAALHVQDREEVQGAWRLGGRVEGIELPVHDEFRQLRLSPTGMASQIAATNRPRALAFVAGELLHAGTRAALLDLARTRDAALVVLIPAHSVGHDEFFDAVRVRALQLSAQHLPADRTVIGVVPLARPADSNTLARAALAAKNCGASELVLDVTDGDSWDRTALENIRAEVGITIGTVGSWGFSHDLQRLANPNDPNAPRVEMPPAARDILSKPAAAASWLLTPAEIDALERAHPPRDAQGFAVFLTGLSGSGKSTIARALRHRLLERTGRPVTLLDGDLVRRHLSSELGFSREHRDLNILRIGWVASEIVRHGGIAICAPIAPYDAIRKQVRDMIEPAGGFLLVHVSTPLETCEARDRKGLYAKARAGLLPNFTGVSDPYEPPADAALVIDTRDTSVDAACALIVARLTSDGYLVQQS